MLTKIDIPLEYYPKVYVYRRKEVWWWKFQMPDGCWFYTSAGADERRARQNARLKERDLSKGMFAPEELDQMQSNPTTGALTIDSAVERYLRITGPTKTGETLNGEIAIIKAGFNFLKKECEVTLFNKVKESHILAYRDHLLARVGKSEITSVTASNRLKAVKKIFRWFKKRKEILLNPALEIEPIEVSAAAKTRKVTLSVEQIRQLVQARIDLRSGFHVKAFVLFMYATGLRPGEVRHLEWDDIDFKNRVIHLCFKPSCPTKYGLGWKPKWGKERHVYLNEMALMILNSLPRLESVGYIKGVPHPAQFVFVTQDRFNAGQKNWKRIDDPRYSWRLLLVAAGIWTAEKEKLMTTDCPFHRHDVRRSWSAHAKQSGVFSVAEASAVLGHDPQVNIDHYGAEIEGKQLQQKMLLHPSNDLIACYTVVTDAVQDEKNEKGKNCRIAKVSK